MNIQPELGRFLRRIRKKRKRTLAQVGLGIGKSAQYVCDIEKGLRGNNGLSYPLMIKFADYLDIPIETIMDHCGFSNETERRHFEAFYASTRSKVRAKRVDACYQRVKILADSLESERAHCSAAASRTIIELQSAVAELHTALFVG